MSWSNELGIMASRKSDLDIPGNTESTEDSRTEVQPLNLCLLTATGNVMRFRIAPANTKRALSEIDYAAEKEKVVDLFNYTFGCAERIRINPRNAVGWWLEDLDGRRR